MSPVEILQLAGQAASPSPSADRADAGAFAALMDDQSAPVTPRGRLGVGRWLLEQAETVRRPGGDLELNAALGLLVNPLDRPVVNPGPNAEVKTDQPLINPGEPTAAKSVPPLINPGVAQTKTEGALINPGPGATPWDDAQVLPGVGGGKADGPQINTGQPANPTTGAGTAAGTPEVLNAALQALAAEGQTESVDALALAARQAVARAPEAGAAAGAAPRAPDPELPEVAPSADAALAAADADDLARVAAATGSATGPVVALGEGAGQASGSRAQAIEPTASDMGSADLVVDEPSVQPQVSTLEAPAGVTPARLDAVATAGRLSFDALAQVSAQIIRRLEARTTRFDMELNPVELGRVDVRLDIDAEGRLAARLAFDNPAAAAELRGRVDELRRELQQAGFQLADDAFSFTDREGSGHRRGFDAEEGHRAHARFALAADEIDAAAQPALRAMTRLGLDVRV